MAYYENGTAVFKDLGGLIQSFEAVDFEAAKVLFSKLLDVRKALGLASRDDIIQSKIHDMFITVSSYGGGEESWRKFQEKYVSNLREVVSYAEQFDQVFRVKFWQDGAYAYLVLGNEGEGVVVFDPEKHLAYTPEKDYSDMTICQVRTMIGAAGGEEAQAIVPKSVEDTLTTGNVQSHLEQQKQAMDSLSREMEAVKNAEVEGLREIQAQVEKLQMELRAKQDAMMAELSAKRNEMERMVEQMEDQIYLLDSQIYAIRCYSGEVVNFTKIRSGKNAPVTEPVVIYQKLRFLDEDLARVCSLYEIQWEEMGLFEEFLRHHPVALDTFAPNERCVVLVRISRTGTRIGMDDRMGCSNMLRKYRYYHGNTVGIIIRNGENLYLGWTDADRVSIQDDLIISRVVTEVSPGEDEPEFSNDDTRRAYERKKRLERRELIGGLISRSFVYNILQGVVDHGNMLPLPDGVKLNKQSEYVIYSLADKWLTDNRFGSFAEIIEKCNRKVVAGDALLVTQNLVPMSNRYINGCRSYSTGTWENDRGRGDRNRTHDCSVNDCRIYPANLIEYEDPVSMIKYRHVWKDFMDEEREQISSLPRRDFLRRLKDELGAEPEKIEPVINTDNGRYEILEEYDYVERHVFVSVVKSEWYYRNYKNDESAGARANFELYDREFINPTYLNTVWLEWCINNQKLGNWVIGGQAVDYAYGIRYLKTALDHVRSREADEAIKIGSIDKAVLKDPDWPVKLSLWKMEAGVRQISDYQAKRFVKYWQSEGKDRKV